MHTRTILLLAAILLGTCFTPALRAGGYGGSSFSRSACAESKWQTPRYHQSLPFHHYEKKRRFHAARCRGEVAPAHPYLVKTVVVRKKREPYYSYDSRGRRHCTRVLVTTYKEIYSDGSCRVYTRQG